MFHVEQSDNILRPWIPGAGQIPCYLTHTTEETHDIIRENLVKGVAAAVMVLVFLGRDILWAAIKGVLHLG